MTTYDKLQKLRNLLSNLVTKMPYKEFREREQAVLSYHARYANLEKDIEQEIELLERINNDRT